MNLTKIFRNSQGMGMVEVLMAVAISGGLALTLAKLLENSSQNAKQIEAKNENTNLKALAQDTLNNSVACTNTFAHISAANFNTLALNPTNSFNVPNIKDRLNNIKYSPTTTNLAPLTITSMTLTNYNGTEKTGDLLIQSTFRKSATVTQIIKPIRIGINFNFNAVPQLTACSTMAVGGEWLLSGNAATDEDSNYIGTADSEPLIFRVNAQKSGRIDSTGQTFLGYQSGNTITSTTTDPTMNTGVGFNTLRSLTTADGNVAVGYRALYALTTGEGNTAIGRDALFTTTTGYDNVAIGMDVLKANTTGNNNTALGRAAMLRNTTGVSSVAMGNSSLYMNTTGNHNIGIGQSTLAMNTTGSRNIAMGDVALYNNTTANYNHAIGNNSMMANTTGYNNVAMGYASLFRNTTGAYNVAIGDQAGSYNTTGTYNTFLGQNSGPSFTGGSRNVFIGSMAGAGYTSGSDKLYIDSINSAVPLIGGDFSSSGRYVKINNKLAIGLAPASVPNSTLVVGNAVGGIASKIHVFDDSGANNVTGVNVDIRPAGFADWSLAINASNYTPGGSLGSYAVGIKGNASANTVSGQGRMYGGWFTAGNGNPGHNYGIYTAVSGTERGTALFASATNVFPQDTDAYAPGNTKWAGVFVGPVHVEGQLWVNGTIRTSGGIDTCPSGWGCDGYFWDIRTHGIAYTNVQNLSDRRLKKNIKDLDDSFVKKLLKLNPVQFEWRKDKKTGKESKGIHYGFIAQEIEEVWPQLVNTATDEMKTKSIAGPELISPLVKAFQYLNDKMIKNKAMFKVMQEGIEERISHLEDKIKTLEKENQSLKASLENMKKQQDSFAVRMQKLEAKFAK